MTYELAFDPRALREWHKLGETVKAQFKSRLGIGWCIRFVTMLWSSLLSRWENEKGQPFIRMRVNGCSA